MQKTTKNLLTKIFVLLTVIFCVFALALGAIGCANNEETKAITKISVNGMTITVEYSDGSKEDLTVEGEEAEGDCAHVNSAYVEKTYLYRAADETEGDADVCSISVYDCKDCNHLYAKQNAHNYTEHQDTDSTCVEHGFVGKKCQDENCKYVNGEVKPLAGHTYSIEIDVAVDTTKVVNKCLEKWYEKGYICSVCGEVNIEANDPVKHIGHIEEIKTVKYATDTEKGAIGGHCDLCNDRNAVLVEVPNLVDGMKAGVYTKTAKSADDTNFAVGTGHYAQYLYNYEGKDYNVVPADYIEMHLDKAKIDDYTKEEYPELKLVAGEKLSCAKDAEYADMAYVCADCDTYVVVEVKAAHTLDQTKAPVAKKVIDATKIPADKLIKQADLGKHGCEYGAGNVEFYYTCEVCKADVPVVKDQHSLVIAKNADGSEKVTTVYDKDDATKVTGYKVGLVCEVCKVETTVDAKSYQAPDCDTPGFVEVEGYDKIELKATGKHVVEGIEGFVDVADKGYLDLATETPYDYADVKDIISNIAHGTKFECAQAPREFIVDCTTCDEYVVILVAREHDIVKSEYKEGEEPTCVKPGTLLFNCGYEDCKYYVADEKDYLKKNVGEMTVYDEHKLSYDKATKVLYTAQDKEDAAKKDFDGEFKVSCSVEDCYLHTPQLVQFNLTEMREFNCVDYKAGKTNTDTYTFKAVEVAGEEPVELKIVEDVENTIHVLKVGETKTTIDTAKKVFTIGDPGIKKISGTIANCKSIGEGGFDCDLCGDIAKVQLTGKCVEPADADKDFVEDTTAFCEKAMNKYWVCELCGRRHVEEQLAPAQGHNFVVVAQTYEMKDGKKVGVTDVTIKCDCAGRTVVIGKDKAGNDIVKNIACELNGETITIEKEDLTLKPATSCEYFEYTYSYASEKTAGYTQNVTIKVVNGDHTFMKAADGKTDKEFNIKETKVADGKTYTRYSKGRYCTVCKDYVIDVWTEWVLVPANS